MYLNEFVSTLYEALITPMDKVTSANEYASKSMTWFGYARNLIHELGYEGESVMNGISWQYAIAEALKVSGIEIVPGIYRRRPSYARIIQLRCESVRPSIQQAKVDDVRRGTLSASCLSFTLPLQELPMKFQEWYETFLSRNAESGRSAENANKFRQRQNLVRRLVGNLNMNRCYDILLVIYATLLSLRRPLPYTMPGHRRKEWSNLKNGSQSIDIYATGIICVGLYYKYTELRQGLPDEMEWTEFRRKLGELIFQNFG
jgi:hypothetical protein